SYDIPVLAAANVDSSDANSRDVLAGARVSSNVGRFQVWLNQATGGAGMVPGKVGTATNPVAPNASCFDSPGTGEVQGLAVGDLNGDGIADVVLGTKTAANAGKIEVWWGNGYGSFSHTPASDVYAASGEVRSVAIADMNADGYPDIVCGSKTNTPDTQGA